MIYNNLFSKWQGKFKDEKRLTSFLSEKRSPIHLKKTMLYIKHHRLSGFKRQKRTLCFGGEETMARVLTGWLSIMQ